MGIILVAVFFIVIFACAIISYRIAKKKGLNPLYWAFMGLICGPFVVMLVSKEPSKK